MPRLGVSKTDITQLPVPFRNMSMKLVQVTVLCTKAVRLTMTVLVKKPVIPKPVRQARSSKRIPDAVLMITHSAPVVRRQDVRAILRQIHLLTAQTARTAASTPVIIPVT